MRNAQIKVAISADFRAQLEWAAAILGEAPSTLAARMIRQALVRQLDDADLRSAWQTWKRTNVDDLVTLEGGWADSGPARRLRDQIRRGVGLS